MNTKCERKHFEELLKTCFRFMPYKKLETTYKEGRKYAKRFQYYVNFYLGGE